MMVELRVLSLGGGVQSSVMALMGSEGLFGDPPDFAVFADTQWEPPHLYRHLDLLEKQVKFPIYRVNNGNLREDLLNLRTRQGRENFVDIPIYLKNKNGRRKGIGRRQCTNQYKIKPIHRKIREVMGLGRIPPNRKVEMWIGISCDEAERMNQSKLGWEILRYPLIEAGLTRKDCLDWWADRNPGVPLRKSACVGCPYQSRGRWIELKQSYPDIFDECVRIDASLRTDMFRTQHDSYLHPDMAPLELAVNENTLFSLTDDQFQQECEGHCGV